MVAPVVNQAREGGQGEARQAITPQFLSSYILLLLNNLLTQHPLALGTGLQWGFNNLKKTWDCFCVAANIQTRLWFSRQHNFWLQRVNFWPQGVHLSAR